MEVEELCTNKAKNVQANGLDLDLFFDSKKFYLLSKVPTKPKRYNSLLFVVKFSVVDEKRLLTISNDFSW